YTKRDSKPFAILLIEDFTGQTEVMVWNETYLKCRELIEAGKAVILRAKVELDSRTETNRLTAEDVRSLVLDPNAPPVADEPFNTINSNANSIKSSDNSINSVPPVIVNLRIGVDSDDSISSIKETALDHPGDRPLHLQLSSEDGRSVILVAGDQYKVSDTFTTEHSISPWLNLN
ncbi:MAG: OB-fold nucleic acid binding domain-containing protein, partial [Verrucomicrobiota bacterium]